jgi:hypothetical protein
MDVVHLHPEGTTSNRDRVDDCEIVAIDHRDRIVRGILQIKPRLVT